MRTHDFAPASHTAHGDVVRCIVVGVPNEVTPRTIEDALRASVSLIRCTRTHYKSRSVCGVHTNERNPSRLGLLARNRPSWSNAHQCNAARWGLRNRTRSRIRPSCSMAIPRPVRLASATMLLLIRWLMSAANRRSLRRRFRSSRRADLVLLACNRFWSVSCRRGSD